MVGYYGCPLGCAAAFNRKSEDEVVREAGSCGVEYLEPEVDGPE